MNAERAQVGWAFWLWWLLAGAAGLVIGAVLGGALVDTIFTAGYGALSGAAVGAAVGTAQWLLLRKHFSRAGWWVLATTAGFALFGAVGNILDAEINLVLAFAMVGSVIGIIQWLVLRQHFSQAGWWVVASALAFSVFAASGDAVYAAVGEQASVAVSLAVLATYGGITGAALIWLLRRNAS